MQGAEPATREEAAEVLRAAADEGRTVRFRGGGTKLGWGNPVAASEIELSTLRLGRIVEHNAADLTAVLEGGVTLASAQAAFAREGQRLALDPPLGAGSEATIGGVVATEDSGPLRHRYGSPRDLLLGMTIALSDGTVATSGGKVIKNVAGYDLAKLFAGSFGTLGLIVQVAVRLHPLPRDRVTAVGTSDDPAALQRGALSLARAPLEIEALDVTWAAGRGSVLARLAGAAPEPRAMRAAGLMAESGLEADVTEEDRSLWVLQRGGQRMEDGTIVKVSAQPADLERVIRTAGRLGAGVVGRAGQGILWLGLPDRSIDDAVGAVEEVRHDLSPRPCVVLDGPLVVRQKLDVWGEADGPAIELMRRLKVRFDPAGVCNPGLFVGGI